MPPHSVDCLDLLEGQRAKGKRGVNKRGRKVSRFILRGKKNPPHWPWLRGWRDCHQHLRNDGSPATSRLSLHDCLRICTLILILHCCFANRQYSTWTIPYWSSEVLRVHPEHPLSVLFEHLLNWPLGHSRLLGVIIPQAQEFAISDSVYRGLVEVLIRGPCLD